jgi:hypothetical protein
VTTSLDAWFWVTSFFGPSPTGPSQRQLSATRFATVNCSHQFWVLTNPDSSLFALFKKHFFPNDTTTCGGEKKGPLPQSISLLSSYWLVSSWLRSGTYTWQLDWGSFVVLFFFLIYLLFPFPPPPGVKFGFFYSSNHNYRTNARQKN